VIAVRRLWRLKDQSAQLSVKIIESDISIEMLLIVTRFLTQVPPLAGGGALVSANASRPH